MQHKRVKRDDNLGLDKDYKTFLKIVATSYSQDTFIKNIKNIKNLHNRQIFIDAFNRAEKVVKKIKEEIQDKDIRKECSEYVDRVIEELKKNERFQSLKNKENFIKRRRETISNNCMKKYEVYDFDFNFIVDGKINNKKREYVVFYLFTELKTLFKKLPDTYSEYQLMLDIKDKTSAWRFIMNRIEQLNIKIDRDPVSKYTLLYRYGHVSNFVERSQYIKISLKMLTDCLRVLNYNINEFIRLRDIRNYDIYIRKTVLNFLIPDKKKAEKFNMYCDPNIDVISYLRQEKAYSNESCIRGVLLYNTEPQNLYFKNYKRVFSVGDDKSMFITSLKKTTDILSDVDALHNIKEHFTKDADLITYSFDTDYVEGSIVYSKGEIVDLEKESIDIKLQNKKLLKDVLVDVEPINDFTKPEGDKIKISKLGLLGGNSNPHEVDIVTTDNTLKGYELKFFYNNKNIDINNIDDNSLILLMNILTVINIDTLFRALESNSHFCFHLDS